MGKTNHRNFVGMGGVEKYQIILADPPWSYKVWTAKGGHKSASAHYKVMDLKSICQLPIQKIVDENCVLFLWATFPNLPEAFEVIKAWGFTYKTVGFVWVKIYSNKNPVCGLGYWTRANAEICLLATKGNPHRISKNVSQVILTPKGEHSSKPDIVKDRIVMLMGDLPRIELFARDHTPLFKDKWERWGDEVESDIELL